MLKIKVKLPDMKRLLPERAELVEAVSVNAAELVMECVRDNFLRRGNKENGSKRRKDYWSAAADAVEMKSEGNGRCRVSISKEGVALHYYGGTVRPRPDHKALALPTRDNPEPDKAPRAYPQGALYLIPRKGKPPLLFLPESNEGKLTKKGKLRKKATLGPNGRVMFTLLSQTTHKADPSVLPGDDKLRAVARAAAEEVIRELQ